MEKGSKFDKYATLSQIEHVIDAAVDATGIRKVRLFATICDLIQVLRNGMASEDQAIGSRINDLMQALHAVQTQQQKEEPPKETPEEEPAD